MNEVRSNLPAVQPQTPSPVRSAQAAFFRAAMEQVTGVQTQAVPPEATLRPQAAPTDTGRLPRPGSLLDIKV
jgi:hypothetical protein